MLLGLVSMWLAVLLKTSETVHTTARYDYPLFDLTYQMESCTETPTITSN